LAAAAAVGTLLAGRPRVGCPTGVVLYISTRLHLNKVMAVHIQHLYAPPFVPFLCIEVGHYIRHGAWWTDFSREAILESMHLRALEWLIGSFLLAPVFAVLAGGITFVAARTLTARGGATKAVESGA